MPDYRKFEHQIQFLEEISNILDVKTPLKKVKDSERKSLEKIAGNYIFTADNFVKLVLILHLNKIKYTGYNDGRNRLWKNFSN